MNRGKTSFATKSGGPQHDAARAFPFDSPALNAVTLHPRVLAAVAQLLRVKDPLTTVRLAHAPETFSIDCT